MSVLSLARRDLERLVDWPTQLVDIGTLGIKWRDLRVSIESMQRLVELIGLVVRNAGFAWHSLDHQLSKASNSFWGARLDAR